MNAKLSLIQTYFRIWREDLVRVEKLLNSQEYYCEAILILTCHIGAIASARFPFWDDGKAYKVVVKRYSGMRYLYEKIDLLFFYQWPKSEFKRSKMNAKHSRPYQKIIKYSQIKKNLIYKFGDELTIKNDSTRRYVTIKAIKQCISPSLQSSIGWATIYKNLSLFSVCEILYRYIRCHAVHNVSFPLVNIVTNFDGPDRFEDSHLITGKCLFKTVNNILINLEKECLSKIKFPWDLRNR